MKRNLIEVETARPWFVLSGRGFLNLSVCLILLAMLSSPAHAQVGAASLSGTVEDTTGASVPGAGPGRPGDSGAGIVGSRRPIGNRPRVGNLPYM